ncbi:hypothetical protein NSTC731_04820 [Nostoc sp. DSM 114167]|jgi:hypothetical protein
MYLVLHLGTEENSSMIYEQRVKLLKKLLFTNKMLFSDELGKFILIPNVSSHSKLVLPNNLQSGSPT